MAIVSKKPIKGIRPGRQDYSSSVQQSPLPTVRSYQEPANFDHTFENVATGETVSHEADTFDLAHFILNVIASATANVAIHLKVYSWKSSIEDWAQVFEAWGYQNAKPKIKAGYPVKKIKIEVTNQGDVPVDIIYSHYGVKGIEKIELGYVEAQTPE